MDFTTATPVEIDTELARIYTLGYAAQDAVKQVEGWLRSAVEGNEKYHAGSMRHSSYTDEKVAELRSNLAEAVAAERAIWAETKPYDDEFVARGGWTRFYEVRSSGGHIHSSQHCSTCNNGRERTRFGWHPELSGSSEAEALATLREAACMMCTTCFPTAPVGWDQPVVQEGVCPGVAAEGYNLRRMSPRGTCTTCGTSVSVTKTGRARRHQRAA